MFFNAAYSIIGGIDNHLLENVNNAINNCVDVSDYTYSDHNAETQELSWSRIDFMRAPSDVHLKPLYDSIEDVINFIYQKYTISQVNSASISVLKPRQVLDEHTDGRFIHRLTDRYLIPLMHSTKNYNYGYYGGNKVVYPLEFGKIYRINNAIVHSAVNLEDADRFNLLLDTFDPRLKEKFKNHPDLLQGLTVHGINKQFELGRKPILKGSKSGGTV